MIQSWHSHDTASILLQLQTLVLVCSVSLCLTSKQGGRMTMAGLTSGHGKTFPFIYWSEKVRTMWSAWDGMFLSCHCSFGRSRVLAIQFDSSSSSSNPVMSFQYFIFSLLHCFIILSFQHFNISALQHFSISVLQHFIISLFQHFCISAHSTSAL